MTPDKLKELAEWMKALADDPEFPARYDCLAVRRRLGSNAALLSALAEAKRVRLWRHTEEQATKFSVDRYWRESGGLKLPEYEYATALILPEKP